MLCETSPRSGWPTSTPLHSVEAPCSRSSRLVPSGTSSRSDSRRRSRIRPRVKRRMSAWRSGPVQSNQAGRVVVAVVVVVAALRPADLVAHQQHRRAERQQLDGQEVLDLAAAQALDRRVRRSVPRRRSSSSGSGRCRRGCPRRSPRCASRRRRRGRSSVKPSWQVTKLMLAWLAMLVAVDVRAAEEPLHEHRHHPADRP